MPSESLTTKELEFLAVVAKHAAEQVARGAEVTPGNVERWMRVAIARQAELLEHLRRDTDTGRAVATTITEGIWSSIRREGRIGEEMRMVVDQVAR